MTYAPCVRSQCHKKQLTCGRVGRLNRSKQAIGLIFIHKKEIRLLKKGPHRLGLAIDHLGIGANDTAHVVRCISRFCFILSYLMLLVQLSECGWMSTNRSSTLALAYLITNGMNRLNASSLPSAVELIVAGVWYLRRGKNKLHEIGDQLDMAEDNGQITSHEGTQVLGSDLLWGGKLKRTKEELFLVVEVSFTAEQTDVERATKRAAILRSIGLPALPVVAGINWPSDTVNEAHKSGVVIVRDMSADQTSWQEARLTATNLKRDRASWLIKLNQFAKTCV